MTSPNWSELPDHIVAKILSNLNLSEKFYSSLVCKPWADAFNHPTLWSEVVVFFNKSGEDFVYPNYTELIERYGHLIRKITLYVDQTFEKNRILGCKLIQELSKIINEKLKTIKFSFVGENPLFYSGAEYIESLRNLFGSESETNFSQLTTLDLSGLNVPFDDSVINLLAKNHPNLENVNLVNKVLMNTVSPDSMYNLIYRCRKLKDLKVFYNSMTEDTMVALAEDRRTPLKHLGLSCRRKVKFFLTIPSSSWSLLVSKSPDLKVTLFFDHTCPLKRVSKIMKPEIPVQILQLETFTMIHSELTLASMQYSDTLEMLVLQTRYSEELGKALVNLSNCCKKLKELYVYCVLKKWVVDEILLNLPSLKENGRYILRWKQSPEPWIVGVEEGD